MTTTSDSYTIPRATAPLLPALAIGVFFGVLASVALWYGVERGQSAAIERNAAAHASMLAKLIQVRIDEQELGALRRWVGSWAQQESIDSAAWRAEAQRFLSEHPAYAAMVRIDREGASDVVGAGASGAAVRDLIERIEHHPLAASPGDTALGPIRLPDGGAALALPIPFRGAGGDTGLLFALLEPDVALSRVLELGATGYSVRVVYGSENLLDVAHGPTLPAPDRFWRSQPVVLSTGTPLIVGVHPTALLAGRPSRTRSLLALSGGLAISALAASAVSEVHRRVRRRAAASATTAGESLEARVGERTRVLQQTIEELESMNASVSHDLRTPLGAVITYAVILSEHYGRNLDASAHDFLRRIASSARTAVTLSDGLLAFSRSGREEIHKTTVDMQRLVESVWADLIGTGGATPGTLEIGSLPDAYADPVMMRRIYTNLISNARKFVERGAVPHVEIGGEQNGGELVYFVRDRGIGFDMQASDRLFIAFERLHDGDYEGDGIGLASVARLVRRHGGRVWAHGAPRKGATFLFSLPLPPLPPRSQLDPAELVLETKPGSAEAPGLPRPKSMEPWISGGASMPVA